MRKLSLDVPKNSLIKTVSKESSLEKITDSHESYVIEKVNLQNHPINSQAYWDDSENFVIDINKFKEVAARGRVNIRLPERDFDIEFDEITVFKEGDSCYCSVCIKSVSCSKAEFYVYGEVLCGSIEFRELMYTIA